MSPTIYSLSLSLAHAHTLAHTPLQESRGQRLFLFTSPWLSKLFFRCKVGRQEFSNLSRTSGIFRSPMLRHNSSSNNDRHSTGSLLAEIEAAALPSHSYLPFLFSRAIGSFPWDRRAILIFPTRHAHTATDKHATTPAAFNALFFFFAFLRRDSSAS